ncbi:MAG: hypothetical protein AAF533_25605 [Acidobacteriota bacterium]
MRKSLSTIAVLALSLGVVSTASAEEVHHEVDVRKVVVRHGDGDAPAGRAIMVRREQVNDATPTLGLELLNLAGGDGERLDLSDIDVGESRSFEVGDGRWMEITREENALAIAIDDEETIRVPFGGGDHGHAGMMTFVADDGHVIDLQSKLGDAHGNVFMFTTDEHAEGEPGAIMSKVITAFAPHVNITADTIGGAGTWVDENGVEHALEPGSMEFAAFMPGLPGGMFGLPMGGPVNESCLADIESYQDADPAVQAKVLEVLQELADRQQRVLGGLTGLPGMPHVEMIIETETDDGNGPVRQRRVIKRDAASRATPLRQQ